MNGLARGWGAPLFYLDTGIAVVLFYGRFYGRFGKGGWD